MAINIGRACLCSIVVLLVCGDTRWPVGSGLSGLCESESRTSQQNFGLHFHNSIGCQHSSANLAETTSHNRGGSNGREGLHEQAIADFREAMRLDPILSSATRLLAVALTNRGVGYEKQGDHERAILDFREALQFDSNNAGARKSLAVALNNRGARSGKNGELDRSDSIIRRSDRAQFHYAGHTRAVRKHWSTKARLSELVPMQIALSSSIRVAAGFAIVVLWKDEERRADDGAIANFNEALRLDRAPHNPTQIEP